MAFEFQHGDLKEPRRWQSTWIGRPEGMGKRVAYVSCPDCGRKQSVGEYLIADDGMVARLVCSYRDCNFCVQNVRLVGWAKEG